ncbi:hypothetical protein JKF63_02215 [Porcisia hertigi]|uniref:Uncharacterized protein n=1 Tax=Porcisia hertigi TaxID=2761500 RepID=A0A836IDC3_9TRYP|nr:hypothetical protein JKF63_02215 [Porcisia hertigi]
MATLRDGRFVFIHACRQNLLVEQAVKAAAVSPSSTSTVKTAATKGSAAAASSPPYSSTFQVLYGGVVHAFALNAAQSHLALVCPAGSAAAMSPESIHLGVDAVKTVLRLFSFSCGEVGELIDELVTEEACDVVWVGNRYLALDVRRSSKGIDVEATAASRLSSTSSTPSTSIILIEVTRTPEKLKFVRQDEGVVSPVSAPGSSLCDIHVGRQSLRFWNLKKGKVTWECTLPNRRRRRKIRTAAATCSAGPFVFVVNNDWTVHGFHVDRHAVRELQPMLSQFESLSVNIAKNRSDKMKMGEANSDGKVVVDGEVEDSSIPPHSANISPPTHGPARPRLFAYAISDTQVLLALQGSPTIIQCACEAKGASNVEWVVVAKMRLPPRLHPTCEVVGISARGCLVRQYGVEEGAGQASPPASALADARTGAPANVLKTVTYFVVPLEMKATGKAPVEAAVLPPMVSAVSDCTGAKKSSVATLNADRACEKSGVMGAAPEGSSVASRKEGKRKRKKKSSGANVDTPLPTSLPAATPKSLSGVGNNEANINGHRSAVGPLQCAVARLLVHIGISDKGELLGASPSGDATRATDSTTDAAPLPATGSVAAAPSANGCGWNSVDVLITVGGAVVGVVLGTLVLRRFSLL